jgi:hypothetical protein
MKALLVVLKPLRKELFETNLQLGRNRVLWKLSCPKKRRMLLWMLKKLEPLAKKRELTPRY